MSITSSLDTSHDLALDVKNLAKLKTMAQQNSPEAVKATAKQFEALFLNMMLKTMRQASPADSLLQSRERTLYTEMLDQQLSQTMAGRGMGLADMLIAQLDKSAVKPLTHSAESVQPIANLRPSVNTARLAATYSVLPLIDDEPVINQSLAETVKPSMGSAAEFCAQMQGQAEQAQTLTGIPAAYILAQAALESGWGQRDIRLADGSASHNLFGIKAGADWQGKVAEVLTTEYQNGVAHKVVAKFKAYDSAAEAFTDYAQMLTKNPRYQALLANAQSAEGFAWGMQKAGYATDPAYAGKLLKVIQRIESA